MDSFVSQNGYVCTDDTAMRAAENLRKQYDNRIVHLRVLAGLVAAAFITADVFVFGVVPTLQEHAVVWRIMASLHVFALGLYVATGRRRHRNAIDNARMCTPVIGSLKERLETVSPHLVEKGVGGWLVISHQLADSMLRRDDEGNAHVDRIVAKLTTLKEKHEERFMHLREIMTCVGGEYRNIALRIGEDHRTYMELEERFTLEHFERVARRLVQDRLASPPMTLAVAC